MPDHLNRMSPGSLSSGSSHNATRVRRRSTSSSQSCGTVPGELLGHSGFGALLGRLARPQFIARAIAPLALTLVFTVDPTRRISLYALAAIGVVALGAYQLALRSRQRFQRL